MGIRNGRKNDEPLTTVILDRPHRYKNYDRRTILKKQFQKIEDNFNLAVISNSVDEIKKCITSDWVLVDTQGGIIPQ